MCLTDCQWLRHHSPPALRLHPPHRVQAQDGQPQQRAAPHLQRRHLPQHETRWRCRLSVAAGCHGEKEFQEDVANIIIFSDLTIKYYPFNQITLINDCLLSGEHVTKGRDASRELPAQYVQQHDELLHAAERHR